MKSYSLHITFLFTVLLSMVGAKSFAYSFKVNGIYYNITNSSTKTVSVTYQNFYSPTDLESVPDGYYYVGVDYGGDDDYDYHYDYCTSDYSGNISIPSSVTYNGVSYQVTGVSGSAFENCFNVNSIILPSSIQTIGAYAFHGCAAKTIDIPYSVTTIGYRAFKDCSQLTSLTIGENVSSIGRCAFYNVSGTITVNCNIPDAEDYDYSPFWGAKFSNVYICENVTRIGNYAFYHSNITSISLPSSLKSIGYYAFCECQELTTITLPSSLTSIGKSAFQSCSNLSAIEILSAQINSIGELVFYGCDGLTTIIVKNTTPPTITSSTFSNIGNTTLYVPHGSKTLYQAASYWQNFSNIVDFTIDDVFTAKTKEDVDMSFMITSISPMEVQVGDGTNAAIDKSYAGNITIPSSVTIPGSDLSFNVSQVGENAFNGCNLITSVDIPVTVRTIKKEVFYGCSGLQEVVLPNSIKTIPNSLNIGYGTSQGFTPIDGVVENIHVPGSVTWIGRYAINQCDIVVIEDGNNELQLQNRNSDDGYFDGTFSHVKKLYVGRNTDNNSSSYSGETFKTSYGGITQLTDLTFGPLVTKAFWGYDLRGCDKVKCVTSLTKEPFISPDFYQIPQTAVLYVPLGSKEQYASANGWKQFGNITEVTEVTITMDDSEMVYAGDFDLDFSNVDGLKAYTAGDFDELTSTITLNPIQLVSAGKGVILKGAKGTYTVPCANIEATTPDALCGTISGRFIRNTEDENVNYVFDKDEHVFKPVDAAYGCLVSRNGAYLSLPASSVSGNPIMISDYVKGDVNGDGVVNEVDAQQILDVSVGILSVSDLAVPEAINVPGGNPSALEVNAQLVLDYSVATVKPW